MFAFGSALPADFIGLATLGFLCIEVNTEEYILLSPDYTDFLAGLIALLYLSYSVLSFLKNVEIAGSLYAFLVSRPRFLRSVK